MYMYAYVLQFYYFSGDRDCKKQLKDTMIPVLRKIYIDVSKSNLINLPIYVLPSVQLFAS